MSNKLNNEIDDLITEEIEGMSNAEMYEALPTQEQRAVMRTDKNFNDTIHEMYRYWRFNNWEEA